MGWLGRKLGLEERTNAIRMGAAQMAVSDPSDADLSRLIALKEANRHIAEMVKTPGYSEYEAELTRMVKEKYRTIARKIRDKDPSAEWDAAFIDIVNTVLLGLGSNAVYESANLDRLINNKLTAKARLEENERNV